MSTDFMDVRSKISKRAHAALLAEEHATGKTISESIRDVVEAWAEQRVHAATVLNSLLRCEGHERAGEGTP